MCSFISYQPTTTQPQGVTASAISIIRYALSTPVPLHTVEGVCPQQNHIPGVISGYSLYKSNRQTLGEEVLKRLQKPRLLKTLFHRGNSLHSQQNRMSHVTSNYPDRNMCTIKQPQDMNDCVDMRQYCKSRSRDSEGIIQTPNVTTSIPQDLRLEEGAPCASWATAKAQTHLSSLGWRRNRL